MERSLEELKQVSRDISGINQRQEERVNRLELKAITITTPYLFLQAIILLCINNKSPTLSCSHSGIPFTISLLVSFIYFPTFASTILTYYRSSYQLDLNRIDHETILRKIASFRANGSTIVMNGSSYEISPRPDGLKWFTIKVYLYALASGLAAFTAVTLYACHSIACNED